MLKRSRSGEEGSLDRLLPLVYDELRALASGQLRRERESHTLQPTALVNEVYLRLVDQEGAALEDRSHFLALAGRVMRRILVDHARRRNAEKRGAGQTLVSLEAGLDAEEANPSAGLLDVLAFDEALRTLEELDERKARVVELRYFSGLTMDEVAESLGVSKRTAEGDWFFARAWLRARLADA